MTYVIGTGCVDVMDNSCAAGLPADKRQHLADNAAFFTETLPGYDSPLGSPGRAAQLGPLGVDTPVVAALKPQG